MSSTRLSARHYTRIPQHWSSSPTWVLAARLNGSWQSAISSQDLFVGVHDNLRNLGLDSLDIVNYRVMGAIQRPAEGSIAEQAIAV
jgi:aryl-alcohol dehydrogenase-like predicted oxidoreductase